MLVVPYLSAVCVVLLQTQVEHPLHLSLTECLLSVLLHHSVQHTPQLRLSQINSFSSIFFQSAGKSGYFKMYLNREYYIKCFVQNKIST